MVDQGTPREETLFDERFGAMNIFVSNFRVRVRRADGSQWEMDKTIMVKDIRSVGVGYLQGNGNWSHTVNINDSDRYGPQERWFGSQDRSKCERIVSAIEAALLSQAQEARRGPARSAETADRGPCRGCGTEVYNSTLKFPAAGKKWTGELADLTSSGVCPKCYRDLKGAHERDFTEEEWTTHQRTRIANAKTFADAEALAKELSDRWPALSEDAGVAAARLRATEVEKERREIEVRINRETSPARLAELAAAASAKHPAMARVATEKAADKRREEEAREAEFARHRDILDKALSQGNSAILDELVLLKRHLDHPVFAERERIRARAEVDVWYDAAKRQAQELFDKQVALVRVQPGEGGTESQSFVQFRDALARNAKCSDRAQWLDREERVRSEEAERLRKVAEEQRQRRANAVVSAIKWGAILAVGCALGGSREGPSGIHMGLVIGGLLGAMLGAWAGYGKAL